jgi:hypothetical protein
MQPESSVEAMTTIRPRSHVEFEKAALGDIMFAFSGVSSTSRTRVVQRWVARVSLSISDPTEIQGERARGFAFARAQLNGERMRLACVARRPVEPIFSAGR